MEYNDKLCGEVHKRIDERLDTSDSRLNVHSDQIDQLVQHRARTEAKIENLCEQIKNLVDTIKIFMMLFATSMLGFFIWYVQGLGG